MLLRSLVTLSVTAAALAGTGLAGTLTVDDDGDADFAQISDAIAAAANGDLILVSPGSYEDFTLGKGLVILGVGPGVLVGSGSRIDGIPASRRAVLADMSFVDLCVVDCNGTVVLDDLLVAGSSTMEEQVLVTGSGDVRMHALTVQSTSFTREGLRISGSRCELVSSHVQGGSGGDPAVAGIEVLGSSFAHLAGTSVQGGRGVDGDCFGFTSDPGGDGGPAIRIADGSTALVTGLETDLIKGGAGGLGSDCDCDGFGASGVLLDGASGGPSSHLRHSGATLQGGLSFCYGNESPIGINSCPGCSATAARPADPHLLRQLVPTPGGPLRFIVHGQPGDIVTLYLGRSPIVSPIDGYDLDQLTTRERTLSLGPIGDSGNSTFLLTVPGNLPQGFSFYAQAEVLTASGPVHTNSLPVVLR